MEMRRRVVSERMGDGADNKDRVKACVSDMVVYPSSMIIIDIHKIR